MNKQPSPTSQGDADLSPLGQGQRVLYTTEDGLARFNLRADGGTVWLTQLALAWRIQSGKWTSSLDINEVLEEGEPSLPAVKDYLTVQAGRKCQMRQSVSGGANAS